MRKCASKRKLQNSVQQIGNEQSTGGDQFKRAGRISNTFETTMNGLLSIPQEQWMNMSDKYILCVQMTNRRQIKQRFGC
jgi:hypothetical protein